MLKLIASFAFYLFNKLVVSFYTLEYKIYFFSNLFSMHADINENKRPSNATCKYNLSAINHWPVCVQELVSALFCHDTV